MTVLVRRYEQKEKQKKTLKWLPGVPNVQVTLNIYKKLKVIYTWLIKYNLKGHIFFKGGGGGVKVISVYVPKLQ